MNLRIRKKLEKRNGYMHYNAYRKYVNIDLPIKNALDTFIEKNPQYKDSNNMVYVIRNKSKSHPKILELTILANCYPTSISSTNADEINIELQARNFCELDYLNRIAKERYERFMEMMYDTSREKKEDVVPIPTGTIANMLTPSWQKKRVRGRYV